MHWAQPMYVALLNDRTDDEDSKTFENAFSYLSMITLHAVALNLLCIAINRMMAVAHPFSNTLFFSKFKILMAICGIWIFSICLAVFVLTPVGAKHFSPYSHIIIILSFLTCYLRIFWIARKQQRQINIQMESVIHNHRQIRLLKTNRATKTTLLIVLSLMLCFFPDTVYDFHPDYDVNDVRKEWLYTLLFLSCSINPCIYMWRTNTFKLAAKRTFSVSYISQAG